MSSAPLYHRSTSPTRRMSWKHLNAKWSTPTSETLASTVLLSQHCTVHTHAHSYVIALPYKLWGTVYGRFPFPFSCFFWLHIAWWGRSCEYRSRKVGSVRIFDDIARESVYAELQCAVLAQITLPATPAYWRYMSVCVFCPEPTAGLAGSLGEL